MLLEYRIHHVPDISLWKAHIEPQVLLEYLAFHVANARHRLRMPHDHHKDREDATNI